MGGVFIILASPHRPATQIDHSLAVSKLVEALIYLRTAAETGGLQMGRLPACIQSTLPNVFVCMHAIACTHRRAVACTHSLRPTVKSMRDASSAPVGYCSRSILGLVNGCTSCEVAAPIRHSIHTAVCDYGSPASTRKAPSASFSWVQEKSGSRENPKP